MDRNEKILLLQLLLLDIRGNWGWENKSRSLKAQELADELGFEAHAEHIREYREWGEEDGRHFRTSVNNGGYEGMDDWHGLKHTFTDKSDEFKAIAKEYLTFPEYRFDDWKSA
ncbi:hypothetical protein [Brevibacillus borstelensis]|uniref:hypothetical protein n=1 Tax=Brevibacillus borstelensis TaxID=45462 RepID=UPI0020406BE8|nr:hypothetical protein [Brevibacillus borstelensis]MCM3560616.1 hypothetical protein [Brevibacillus borstelensis]WNF07242.1 hypothetical protein RFB14_07390 [Brevibacillus borstelensis]